MSDAPPSRERAPQVRESTVGQLLVDAARECPDRTALVYATADGGVQARWTYAELEAEAARAAHALLAVFQPGERVALWASSRPEWTFVQFGAALAGVVLVTVNPAFREHEASHVLTHARISGAIVERRSRGNPLAETLQRIRPKLDALRTVIEIDQWSEFAAAASAGARSALPVVLPEDPVQIQYTSGTTGPPKGAVLTHRGMSNVPRLASDLFELGDAPTWINAMPLFHVGGCGLSTIGPMTTRGTQVMLDRFDPQKVLSLVESQKATFLGGVPTMLMSLMDHPDFARRDLSSLRVVLSGGAAVAPELVTRIEDALGVRFMVAFGQTEAHGHVTQTRPDDSAEDKAHTIGRAVPFVDVTIKDRATGQEMPVGEIGEICVRSTMLMAGYFDDPAQSVATIDDDGWLHTGDLGTVDGRGYFRFTGRLKEVIVRGGENVHPREIEDVLFGHPAVGHVAVIGVPDARWGEQVVAFVQRSDDQTSDDQTSDSQARHFNRANGAELRTFVRSKLASNKAPTAWVFVDALPMTASGKVQKFELLERWNAGEFASDVESTK